MSNQRKITVAKDGPYVVSGSVPLAVQVIRTNKEGESTEWVEGKSFSVTAQYALCRCGQSKNKPFCDGTHGKIGFDGTETASQSPVLEQAEELDEPSMQLADAEGLCAFARFCDPNGKVWNQVHEHR
jgi:CDGSH-type Zn-finger protein